MLVSVWQVEFQALTRDQAHVVIQVLWSGNLAYYTVYPFAIILLTPVEKKCDKKNPITSHIDKVF